MDNMINLISLEGESLTESASDLVEAHHSSEGVLANVVIVVLASSDDYGVEIIVTELPSLMPGNIGIITENSPIGIPLSDSRRVGSDGLLCTHPLVGAETLRHVFSLLLQ